MGRVAGTNNRRHERRRKVQYMLTEKKEDITREAIDSKTMLSLLQSLEKGAVGQFGLIKLSGLLIDTIFPTPSQYSSFPFPTTTLCELAGWRNKDGVVSNLLRAGANPSITLRYYERKDDDQCNANINSVKTAVDEIDHMLLSKNGSSLSEWALQAISKASHVDALAALNTFKVYIEENSDSSFKDASSGSSIFMNLLNEQTYKSHAINISTGHMKLEERDVLSSLHRPYQAWIVNKVVSMRVAGSSNNPSDICLVCHERSALLKWAGKCAHNICEECVWHCLSPKDQPLKNNVAADSAVGAAEEEEDVYEYHGYRLRCPQCHSLCEDDEDEIDRSSDYSTLDITELKKSSFQRFSKLPETVSGLTSKMKAKGGKFKALNFNQVAGSYIGSVQNVRTSALVRAVECDDGARLRALFKAGVDLDARNEYGQTCSHIAAFLDHASALQLLASHGADLTIAANDGTNIFSLSARRNNPAIINVVKLYLKQHPIISPQCFNDMLTAVSDEAKFKIKNNAVTTVLIPFDSNHDGAGSRMIDNAFEETFLNKLDELWRNIPIAPPEKASCNERAYLCDAEGWVIDALNKVLQSSNSSIEGISSPTHAMPHIRFVNYPTEGGLLAPHIDLSRVHYKESTLRSTYTFMLYLSDCNQGGETALLEHLPSIESFSPAIAAVKPKRGRLLLFPHICPHEGCPVVDCPKLFLRGELY